MSDRKPSAFKHGHTADRRHSRTYRAWYAMKARCNNPSNSSYHRYGGRGVTYCDRWEVFANFLEDMGECPEGHQLDKDKLGDGMIYSPSTCCWLTRSENCRYRRKAAPYTHPGFVHFEYQGLSLSQKEWARRLGVTDSAICRWIKRGKSFEEFAAKHLGHQL